MTRRVRQWIGFGIMLIGLGLLCGPFLLGAKEKITQARVVEMFYQAESRKEAASVEQPETTPPAASSTASPEPTPVSTDAFYQAASAYNEALAENGQNGMDSRADVEHFALSALDYGYDENIIGTIRIPRMETELALYLGASEENMAKGAAIFGMTSLPLGGENENVSIAGHRGWRGTPMFRDIQKLQLGDPIYITTPWQTLTYRVCAIEIVSPEDNRWCQIQQGRTLITLMTCHPYSQNTQRYIVFAERSAEVQPTEAEILRANEESFDPSPREVTLVHTDGTSETVEIEPVSVQPDGSEYGSVWSNFMILAEDKMKIVAGVAAVLIALTGIWLTTATIGDARKRSKQKKEIGGNSYESK